MPSTVRRPRKSRRTTKRSRVPTATKRYVKRMMPKTELKRNATYYDEISQSTLTQGSYSPQLSITQGTGLQQRIGTQITVKGFHIKGVVNNNATTPNYIRMLLAWSTIDSATTFSTANIFADANLAGGTAGTGGVTGANILYYPVNRLAFTPVWDHTMKLGGSADPSCTRMFSKFIKMNKTIKYIANNAGDAMQDYQLTLFIFVAESGDDTGLGQTIEVSHVARAFFTDA